MDVSTVSEPSSSLMKEPDAMVCMFSVFDVILLTR
jgi:hypothetical protein